VFLVKVRSLPSGAQVLIDGEPMGQTPFQRRILDTEKNHAVTVRKPGYEPYEHIVSPSDAWVKEGNTEIMKLVAKLTKIKVQAAAPSAVPQATPQPVPALPEKP
jgi:serine/threonine-protein kinase